MKRLVVKKVNMNRAKLIVVLSFVLLMVVGSLARAEAPDYGNDCNSAEPIDPNGTVVEGILSDTSDHDWFSFTAVAGGLYEMTYFSQSGTKYLYVYGPDGCPDQLQLIVDMYASDGSVTKEFFIQHAGTYYIQIPNSGYSSGLYQVSVNLLGTYPTDTYSDTCDDPYELLVDDPCGALYDGITDYGMDEDWFSFATIALHKYEISCYTPRNTNVLCEMYRSDCGNQLCTLSNTTFVSWDGANYDLRLRSSSFNKEGYYEVWVEDLGEVPDDHGNTCDAATPIATNGVEVDGVLQYTAFLFSDQDWFSFTAVAKGLYEMTFFSQLGQKCVYVYGPNECGQAPQMVSFCADTGTATNGVFIEHAGTYYIQIPGGYSSGLYRVSVNLLGTYPTDTYSDTCDDPCELLVDDPCGALYDGITDYGMDEDWFTFATDVLHKYQVSFYRPPNTSTDVVYSLNESDCGGQLYSGTASRTFVSWDGANYDLRAKSSSFSKEGYYEMSVEDMGEQPDDYGNTCDDATPIATNGEEVEGLLQYTADLFSDEDWFSFTASAEGLYEISLFSQSDYKSLYVYGSDGCPDALQQIMYFAAVNGTVTNEVFIEYAGTHYIKICSGSGLYQVSVLSPEPQCGDPGHPYPSGDVNHDCVVNFVDLAMLADQWLVDNRP